MALLAAVVSVAASIVLTPFLMFILCIIFLASIGKSLGVRRLYVNLLLKIFEYGRQHIEVAKMIKRPDDYEIEDDELEPGGSGDKAVDADRPPSAVLANGHASGSNGMGATKASVIKREDLILAPDPGLNYKRTASQERLGSRCASSAMLLAAERGEGVTATAVTSVVVNGNGNIPMGNGDVMDSQENSEQSISTTPPNGTIAAVTNGSETMDFDLSKCLEYVKAGMESIIEDQVTSVFEAEELRSWNLLTRTNSHYEFISWRLSIIWFMGFVVRYFFLLPLRILICFIGVWWLTFCMAAVGYIPEGTFKRQANRIVSVMCFETLSRSLSAVITYHNGENRPRRGICVANHTSPIDVLVLMCDNCYSLIGQSHGGFLGLLQRALARASPHIWFERSEAKDRNAVARRLKEHVSDPNNPPILIFPEGTCINNTSVMQFKKGSFEVGGVIYPVAIKYDPRFGDAFWNSSRYGMLHYLYMMMSSWAIVCDVWYLPPMYRRPEETAIDFASRVKSVIARQGGLVDLMWDGQLKRIKPKKEWKELQQEEFSKRLKGE